jgi:DNA-binding transcriptional regulator LsrR (DeoR family)
MGRAKRSSKRGRPADVPLLAQVREVAREYFLRGATRAEIAEKLDLDPRRVSWLLESAIANHVVRVEIPEPPHEEAGSRLRDKYPHLREALVVPADAFHRTSTGDEVWNQTSLSDYFAQLARLAAGYFDRLVNEHHGAELHVGVTGGERMLRFAQAVPYYRRRGVHVHVTALIGRGMLPSHTFHIEPPIVASLLWARCGAIPGNFQYATVSPYDLTQVDADDPKKGRAAAAIVKREIAIAEKNRKIREVVEAMDKLDVVFAALGNPALGSVPKQFESSMTMMSLLKGVVSDKAFAEQGVVGDFSYCPFDLNGNARPDWSFIPLFLTAGHFQKEHRGIDFFKKMVADNKRVVAFGGPFSLKPTKAALKGKIFNVLMTDEISATSLLRD